MLQRTKAEQVEPVFERFQHRYKRPSEVIAAGPKAVEEIFEKLGLHWRAEFFWKLQRQLEMHYDGQVPDSYDNLVALPGVGQYAATAVRVFAFGKKATVIDANSLRILGRYFGIDFPDHARRSPRVREWAAKLAPSDLDEVRRFNWALIDFGALVCTPSDPGCGGCVLKDDCWYAKRDQPSA